MDFTQLTLKDKLKLVSLSRSIGMACQSLEKLSDITARDWGIWLTIEVNQRLDGMTPAEIADELKDRASFLKLDPLNQAAVLATIMSLSLACCLLERASNQAALTWAEGITELSDQLTRRLSTAEIDDVIAQIQRSIDTQELMWMVKERPGI